MGDPMTNVVSVLWNVLDLAFYLYFCGAFLATKPSRRPIPAAAVCVALFSVITLLPGFPDSLATVCALLLLAACTYWLYDGLWYQKLWTLLLCYAMGGVFCTAVYYGVSSLMGISLVDMEGKRRLYVAVGTAAKLLSLLFAWICRRVRRPVLPNSIRRRWIVPVTLFSGLSAIMILGIFYMSRDAQDMSLQAFLFSGFLALEDAILLALITFMERSALEEQNMSLLHQQMEIQDQSIQTLEKSYRAQRQLSHDFRSQLQTIHGLLASGQSAQAEEYVCQLQALQTDQTLVVNSHHPVLDAVLNMKYHLAAEQNVEMHLNINDLSAVVIHANSLVVIVSNLLDNAIEACCRLPEGRQIYCDLQAGERLYLSIRNSSQPVQIRDGHIETTKEPRREHGFGLLQVRRLLDGLGAEYYFDYADGWFSFVGEIPNKPSLPDRIR